MHLSKQAQIHSQEKTQLQEVVQLGMGLRRQPSPRAQSLPSPAEWLLQFLRVPGDLGVPSVPPPCVSPLLCAPNPALKELLQ